MTARCRVDDITGFISHWYPVSFMLTRHSCQGIDRVLVLPYPLVRVFVSIIISALLAAMSGRAGGQMSYVDVIAVKSCGASPALFTS